MPCRRGGARGHMARISGVVGLTGVVAAAGLAGLYFANTSREERTADELGEVCLRRDLGFVALAAKGCYAPSEFAAMVEEDVLDESGATVSMTLTPPIDAEREPKIIKNCADYQALIDAGWYAETTREMRREEVFTRACAAIAWLQSARPHAVSFFAQGALSEADIESAAIDAPAWFGEAPIDALTDTMVTTKDAAGDWRVEMAGAAVVVQELAHADFNGDGVGDMLVLSTARAEGGTATASAVGLMVKTAAGAPCRFVASD